jgi:hypothetical protein
MDGRILSQIIERKGVDFIYSVQERGPVADSCEHGNEYSGSMKGRGLLD